MDLCECCVRTLEEYSLGASSGSQATALRANNVLTALELDTNVISDKGAEKFADALRVNKAEQWFCHFS